MNRFVHDVTKEIIGFNELMKELTIISPYGRSYFLELQPIINKKDLEEEYQYIETLMQHKKIFPRIEDILHHFKNISSTIKQCINRKTLDLVDLYEIKIQAIYMNDLMDVINQFNIELFLMQDCSEIIQLLSTHANEVSPDFYIYDSYSEKLKTIREKKRKIERILLNDNNQDHQSELKNQRTHLVIKEREEELRVRTDLSQQLSKLILKMKMNIDIIGHLDFVLAKTKLAIKEQGCKPTITDDLLAFNQMHHPLVKNQVEKIGHHYTKNSIQVGQGANVLTGANMSGKSSVMKTIALNVMLAHLGFYVFADSAKIPLVSGVMYAGGGETEQVHGLSSFGREINRINEVIKLMKTEQLLVCVDEFARSTNPNEGQKFVKAFCQYANDKKSIAIVATHYDGVVQEGMNHYQILGLKEDINKKSIQSINDIHRYMDYTLKKVTKHYLVPKEAYRVSILLNIDKDFLKYLNKCYEE